MKNSRGFTLVELIIVVVLLGIVSMTIGSLYSQSISSYLNLLNSSTVVDDADSIQRRFFRDVQRALPNSIRITTAGTKTFLELIPVKTSGRYKSLPNTAPSANACASDDASEVDNDILSVGKLDTCFKTLGNLVDAAKISSSDSIVIYNTGLGDAQTDAYVGGNRSSVLSVTDLTNETKLTFSSKLFPYDGTSQRFFVVSQPITYECDTATRTLKRYTNYGFNASQATSYSNGMLLSNNMSACTWTYNNVINIQKSIVTFKLGLMVDTTNITLVNSANVGNAP